MTNLKSKHVSLRNRNTSARRGLRLEPLEPRNLLAVTAVDDLTGFSVDEDDALDTAINVVPIHSDWDYLDSLLNTAAYPNDGSNWNAVLFDEDAAGWNSGAAPLGYGAINAFVAEFPGDGLATTIADNSATVTTVLFRKEFVLSAAQSLKTSGTISLLCDDGCVVYINGTEVPEARLNMALGQPTPATFSDELGNEAAMTVVNVDLTGIPLYGPGQGPDNGTNVIAVEVHQTTVTSSDVGFELSLGLTGDAVSVLDNDDLSLVNGTPVVNTTPIVDVQNGTLTLSENGVFTYVPDSDFSGPTDAFRYSVTDDDGGSSEASVTITINAVNDAPVAGDDPDGAIPANGYSVKSGSTLVVSDLVSNGVPIIARGSTWFYNDTDTNPQDADSNGTADDPVLDASLRQWNEKGFDPTTATGGWGPSGAAQLGYGDGDENTAIAGDSSRLNGDNVPTYYFVKSFDISTAIPGALTVNMLVDDGGAVYINGILLDAPYLLNPGFDHDSYAAAIALGGDGDEVTWNVDNTGNVFNLTATGNTIAVEIHQSSTTSSDVSFDLDLSGSNTVVYGLLANDSDIDADTLTVTEIDGQPVLPGGNVVTGVLNDVETTAGTLIMNANGTFTFNADANFFGDATFSYTADDGSGTLNATATANVTITVTPLNTSAPVANDDAYSAFEDVPLVVTATSPAAVPGQLGPGLLQNDTHTGDEGQILLLTLVDNGTDPPVYIQGSPTESAGSVTINNDGTFTYTPLADFFGIAEFKYEINDTVEPVDTATVVVTVAPLTKTVADNYTTVEDTPLVADVPIIPDPVIVMARGANWDYLDLIKNDLVEPAAPAMDYPTDAGGVLSWKDPGFNIVTSTIGPWGNGPAILGDGGIDAGPAATMLEGIDDAPDGTSNDITTYLFRSTFTASAAQAAATRLGVRLLSDDGGVLYINGTEVLRHLLPEGPITTETNATAVGNENAYVELTTIDFGGLLLAGANTIAYELHQRNSASSDVGFDIEITELPSIAGVVGNDADVEAVPIDSVALSSGPTNGTVVLNPNGTFTYTPDPNFNGTDTFEYIATAAGVDSLPTTVTIVVTSTSPGNSADFNGDGLVNLYDLAELQDGLGTAATDLTGDGTTNRADVVAFLSSYGLVPAAAPVAAPAAASVVASISGDNAVGDVADNAEEQPNLGAIRDRIITRITDRFENIAARHGGELGDRLSTRLNSIITRINARFERDSDNRDRSEQDRSEQDRSEQDRSDDSPLRRILRARRHHRQHDHVIDEMFS